MLVVCCSPCKPRPPKPADLTSPLSRKIEGWCGLEVTGRGKENKAIERNPREGSFFFLGNFFFAEMRRCTFVILGSRVGSPVELR